MNLLSPKKNHVITFLLKKGPMRSSEIHAEFRKGGTESSLITTKRLLSEMADEDLLVVTGSGRSTAYHVSIRGRMSANIDAKIYCIEEPDKRYGTSRFNFDLLPGIHVDLFTSDEMKQLDNATSEYRQRTQDVPASIQKKELERLIIELSWKSSRIEGNTYTLLDTEKLIRENKEAPGHSHAEAQMILNHKDAFLFVHGHKNEFNTLTRQNLEQLHSILVKDLSVEPGLRKKPVGIVGSLYRPLDNIHQISEAVDALSGAVSRMETPYAKALLALLGISYIQPFADGNKRTSRLMANALLLAHGHAPLSYRSVDENEYREAMLVFYEINSIVPFRKIFVEQYDFSARNYAVR